MISSKEFAMRWRAGLCRIACLALAACAVFCVDAESRTGKIVLAVTGDEPMRDDLKQLVEDFEKAQPLSGDSLALLQGAQAVLARVNTALRSRGFYDARSTATIDNTRSTDFIRASGAPWRHRRWAWSADANQRIMLERRWGGSVVR